ncbi:AAA family ATPase [Segniliparus rugosus]|uniref:AAA family ATPase n=1 Tax=Segniliparus rugosus TaxID=286804 RepID=UPI0003171F88|nr:AAA family ATPase [Segniliparus rugosus]
MAGDPLPTVFESLEGQGVRLLRGQFALVCAGPGCGKSVFALTYAITSGVPTLYVSADSDPFTQASRLLSIVSGRDLEQSASTVRSMRRGDPAERLMRVPIRFMYDAAPSLGRIEQVLLAYEECYGHYPSLIVVDNVTNIRTDTAEEGGDPYAGLEYLADQLHVLARETKACVVGLHHVTGEFNNSDKPVPLNGVKSQVTRVPELVLTMHKHEPIPGVVSLRVSPVKNRNGKADPTGRTFAELDYDGRFARIKDYGAL